MKNLTGKSMNITEENSKAMQQLFPEAFEEGKIDFDVLRQLLGDFVDDEQERYSFKWNGKGKALRLSQTPSMGTLRPCKEESKDWDNTENLYIEGDNLEVLKLLQKSYYGKVKMIYIDPPYNTGGDFVYKDNFRDNIQNYKEITGQIDSEGNKIDTNTESNGRFHTDWLNMMYPRLRLARNLLTDDGVIFISIDDNEQENLKRICEEIFGEDNFVSMLSVENNPKGRKNSAFISVSSEYCLIFAKNKAVSYFVENVPKKSSDMTLDEEGRYVHNSGKRVLVGENNFNKYVIDKSSGKNYSVYFRRKDYSVFIRKEEYGEIDYKLIADGYTKYYSHHNNKLVENTYTEEKFMELFKVRALLFTDDKIYEKNFSDTIRMKSQLVNREYEAIVRGEKKRFSMELTTTGAGTYLKELFDFNEIPFPASKNVGFLRMLISLFEKGDFYILDFFSGSATTANAVMQLNAEDGGNRKFIMVQLQEPTIENSEVNKAGYKNICEIGKERIRRAGDKIKAEAGDKAEDLDIGFKVFKLDSSNMQKWNPQPDDLVMTLQQATDNFLPDRTEQDVLYEIMIKMGLNLTCQIEEEQAAGETVYIIGGGALMICLGRNITTAVAEAVVKLHAEYESELWQVVFRDTGFASDMDKTNVKETLKAAGLDEESFVCV